MTLESWSPNKVAMNWVKDSNLAKQANMEHIARLLAGSEEEDEGDSDNL